MKKELTRQQYLDLYYYMRLNRAVEDMMVKLFRQNKIVGGLYSSLGQEAISVGTAYALEKKDWLAPMIRNIGALLIKGVRPRDIFMQHMAKYDSPTKGKDGTSHFGDLDDLHIVSPISMLGDLIPVMTGVAMAGRYIVDGNDVVAVYSTAKEAVERARAGEGPILIEAKSFRRMGHAQHDPAEYVPKEMRAYWEARDPIVLYEKFLSSEKLLDAKSRKQIEDQNDT